MNTIRLAGAAILALAFTAPAMAAQPHYGDTSKAPAYGTSGTPTATTSTGGAGIQSYKGDQAVAHGQKPKHGPQLGAGGTGSNTGASR